MSGAAIAPSMGKLTRPSLRLLMGMANVRTGVWVPNPRRMESFVSLRGGLKKQAEGFVDHARRAASRHRGSAKEREDALKHEDSGAKRFIMPRPTPRYLLKELLGWNSINDKFLYVSDGGHYENLGLVELLRRGCARVYCFDASGGRQFGALGDAIALARSELGVDITFDAKALATLRENKQGFAQERCATGVLRFTRGQNGRMPESDQVNGRIVYAPTVMTADLPWDVHAFRQEDTDFPHHSTLDQSSPTRSSRRTGARLLRRSQRNGGDGQDGRTGRFARRASGRLRLGVTTCESALRWAGEREPAMANRTPSSSVDPIRSW